MKIIIANAIGGLSYSKNIYQEYAVRTKQKFFYYNLSYVNACFDVDDKYRTDPILISIIEDLKPNGIKIVEIPDDIKWHVRSFDTGQEYIAEEHRTWE